MKVLVTTVWHTGSNYLRKKLEGEGHEVEFMHCEPRVFSPKHLARFDEYHTTYRDPFKVAASWGNRYDLMHDTEIQAHWYSLWTTYHLVLRDLEPHIHHVSDFDGPKINEYLDERLLHDALEREDWELYGRYIPMEMVAYAIQWSALAKA